MSSDLPGLSLGYSLLVRGTQALMLAEGALAHRKFLPLASAPSSSRPTPHPQHQPPAPSLTTASPSPDSQHPAEPPSTQDCTPGPPRWLSRHRCLPPRLATSVATLATRKPTLPSSRPCPGCSLSLRCLSPAPHLLTQSTTGLSLQDPWELWLLLGNHTSLTRHRSH